jgi:hypothetical protein
VATGDPSELLGRAAGPTRGRAAWIALAVLILLVLACVALVVLWPRIGT